MLLSLVILAATTVSVQAFKDTSPFLLFSNSPLPTSFQDVSTSQLQSKPDVMLSAKKFLSGCPSEIYYVVSQPGVSSSDLSSSAAHLKNALSNPAAHTRFTVSEVVGLNAADADDLEFYLQSQCGSKTAEISDVPSALKQRTGTNSSVIVREKYPSISGGDTDRESMVVDADSSLYSVLNELPKGPKYTFIYITSPAINQEAQSSEAVHYEADFNEVVHMDLKRNLQARAHNVSTRDMRPLFEKYEFFNPGLFMGLLVGLLLLSILAVGISALGSLEVSYGAFDKEMGPAAQKKMQ